VKLVDLPSSLDSFNFQLVPNHREIPSEFLQGVPVDSAPLRPEVPEPFAKWLSVIQQASAAERADFPDQGVSRFAKRGSAPTEDVGSPVIARAACCHGLSLSSPSRRRPVMPLMGRRGRSLVAMLPSCKRRTHFVTTRTPSGLSQRFRQTNFAIFAASSQRFATSVPIYGPASRRALSSLHRQRDRSTANCRFRMAIQPSSLMSDVRESGVRMPVSVSQPKLATATG
jgi:hypothetical protein